MALSVRHLYNFNQMFNMRDLMDGGNCAAYCLLVMSYISMFSVKYPKTEINYSRLDKALKTFPQIDKHILNWNQVKHYNIINLIEYTISNETKPVDTLEFFKCLSIEIFKDCAKFSSPIFYLITFEDESQKIMGHIISHVVLLYIPSCSELHFFDSLSGIHIIHLPETVAIDNLHDILIDLIFKKNFLMKLGCNFESKTMELNFWKNANEPSINNALTEGLQKIIKNPNKMPYITANVHERLFLKTNAFMLKLLANDPEMKPSFFSKTERKKPVDKYVDEIELTTMSHRKLRHPAT